jgi:peptidoglycan/xylan/chitin deacetylase (PgdA/CDA1 family)
MIDQSRRSDRTVCVLTFHRIVREPRGLYELSWTTFASIVDLIVTRSLRVLPTLGPEILGDCDVVLTFDDATSDHVKVGEELAARGLPGLFFVPTGELAAPGRLRPEDLESLRSIGHRIGSHGCSHEPLRHHPCLIHELRGSRRRLEAVAGGPVTDFAPPGGIYSRRLLAELRRGGYRAARSLRHGFYCSEHQRWRVPSITVNEVTVRRGWVHAAVTGREPLEARTAAIAKALLPGSVRGCIGSALLARTVPTHAEPKP